MRTSTFALTFLLTSVLSAQVVFAQLPPNVEHQVKAGNLTQEEADMLSGGTTRSSTFKKPIAKPSSDENTSPQNYVSPQVIACEKDKACGLGLEFDELYLLRNHTRPFTDKESVKEEAFRDLTKMASGSQPPSSSTRQEMIDSCKNLITSKLKAPGTVQWPSSPIDVQVLGYVYNIYGEVDAQNGYGALIRSNYSCLAARKNGKIVINGAEILDK